MRVGVGFEWEEVGSLGLTPTGRLDIPDVPPVPGVYRFQIQEPAGTEAYIGESDNLRRRMRNNYASTHTGTTNVRVRELLTCFLVDGRDVRLAIARAIVLDINGQREPADLADKSTRLLVENGAIAVARRDGERIHNL